MVGLLRLQLSRGFLPAGAILLSASAASRAQTPEQVFANAAASHPMSAWIVVPIALVVMTLLILICARFVHGNSSIDAEMRGEAGDRPITPVPGGDGHIHFH